MSEMLKQLFQGDIYSHIWATVLMTVLSTAIAYIIGLPIGIVLNLTDKDGLCPCVWLNRILGFIVNILRSMPFVILMVAFLPVAKFFVGTSLGDKAVIVMLIIAAAPYIARIVESSLKEVDKGVIEAARSMGAGTFAIIRKVYLPEAKPSLIVGAVISTVTVLGYSAMSSTIGGTGLGMVAIVYGHQRFNQDVIWVCVAFTVVIVQIIQEVGMYIALKTDKRIRKKSKKSKQNKGEIKQ